MPFKFERLKDGTLKAYNPLVGDEVWTVPGRSGRPITNRSARQALPLKPGARTLDDCHFCPQNLMHTPAEKARLVADGDSVKVLRRLLPEQAAKSEALFRRVPNLYEIIPWEYWTANHGLTLSAQQAEHKRAYLQDPQGRDHLRTVLGEKLARLGKDSKALDAMGDALFDHADAFFGGSHDVVVSGLHFSKGAEHDDQLLSSGGLSRESHYHFLDFTHLAAQDMVKENSKVVWVSIYQNWLAPAGASFNHLHKQVLGLDALPPAMQRRLMVLEKEPDFYNQSLMALAQRENLALAENEHALAIVEPGWAFPTVAVYSKAAGAWSGLSEDARRGFSDLLWACHQWAGADVSVNEEWFGPASQGPALPLHALVKWRVNTPAGFEGGSQVLLNPWFPEDLRERILSRPRPHLTDVRWADDAKPAPGCLHYRS